MDQGVKTVTDSFSITKNHKSYIDYKIKKNPGLKKSHIIQQGLDMVIKNENQNRFNKLIPPLFIFTVGLVLIVFSYMFMQIAGAIGLNLYFPAFILIIGIILEMFGLMSIFKVWRF